MSDAKFTPGPWAIESEDWGDGVLPTGITDHRDIGVIRSDVGFAFCHEDQPDSEVAWANARFITAAPDLYAACESLQKYWEAGYIPDGAYEPIAKAMAKARGEAVAE